MNYGVSIKIINPTHRREKSRETSVTFMYDQEFKNKLNTPHRHGDTQDPKDLALDTSTPVFTLLRAPVKHGDTQDYKGLALTIPPTRFTHCSGLQSSNVYIYIYIRFDWLINQKSTHVIHPSRSSWVIKKSTYERGI